MKKIGLYVLICDYFQDMFLSEIKHWRVCIECYCLLYSNGERAL